MDSWTEHHAIRWIWDIMALVHVALGIAVVAGGQIRFVHPTYTPLVEMVHGRTWLWGIWVILAGVLMLVPARWPQIFGLWLGMSWMVMWCSMFAVAVVQYPTAGATATVAYGGFAMIDTALLTARVIRRERG